MRRVVLAICCLVSFSAIQDERFDILIRNGRVYDGNGNPWILADVGIVGDRIRAVGRLNFAAKYTG